MSKAVMLDDETYAQLRLMADRNDTKMASIVRQYLLDKKTIYDDLENKLNAVESLFVYTFLDKDVSSRLDAIEGNKRHHPFLKHITMAKSHLRVNRQTYLDDY